MSSGAQQTRGSEVVRAALIDQAAKMLGEVGPSRISVRDVAARAGVNHGQVHHYFGGKRGLLNAAMTHLARGHYEHSNALRGDAPFPPVLSLAADSGYWRAVCQVVMDGDLELARLEVDEGISVPRAALATLLEQHRGQQSELEIKAKFAALAASQLGWVAFEQFMFLVADVEPDEQEALRTEVKKIFEDTVAREIDSAKSI